MTRLITPYTIIRAALLFALLATGFLAVQTTMLVDANYARSISAATRLTTGISPERAQALLDDIDRLSVETDTTTVVDRTEFGTRTFYVGRGGAGRRWLESGYQSYSHERAIKVVPLSDLPGHEIRQVFGNAGGQRFNSQLADIASRYGVASEHYEGLEHDLIGATPVPLGLGVVTVTSAGLILLAVLLNRRCYIVDRLHGESVVTLCKHDAVVALSPLVRVLRAGVIVAGFALAGYTSFDGAISVLRYSAQFVALVGLVCAATWAGAVAAVSWLGTVPPWGWRVRPFMDLGSSYAVRCAVCALMIVSAVSCGHAAQQFARQQSMIVDLGHVSGLVRAQGGAQRPLAGGADAAGATSLADLWQGDEERAQQIADATAAALASGKAVEFHLFESAKGAQVVAMNRTAAGTFLSAAAQERIRQLPTDVGIVLAAPPEEQEDRAENPHSEPTGQGARHGGDEAAAREVYHEAEQPAEQPADEPADQIADQIAEEPAAEPADEPAEQDASPNGEQEYDPDAAQPSTAEGAVPEPPRAVAELGRQVFPGRDLCAQAGCVVATVATHFHFQVFNPLVDTGEQHRGVVLEHPVVVIVPDDFRPVHAAETLDSLAAGTILFANESTAREFVALPGVDGAVFQPRSVGDVWLDQHRVDGIVVRVGLLCAVSSIVGVLALAMACAAVVSRVCDPALRVGYSFGLSWDWRFRWLLCAEGAWVLAASVVAGVCVAAVGQ